VFMTKDIPVVGKSPVNMQSFGIQPLKGLPNVLYSVSNQTFFNPSNIGAKNLGNVTMDVYSDDGIYIGEAFIQDLNLAIGPNSQPNIVSSAILTDKSRPAIEKMFSKWAMGIDQKFRVKGPTSATSGFYPLYNTSDQEFTVVANKIPLVTNAIISQINPVQTLINPTNMDIKNSDVLFSVTVPPLSNGLYVAFNVSFPFQASYACPSSEEGILLGYAGPGGTNSVSDSFILPANSSFTTQFQPLVGTQFCLDLIPIATCCGLGQGVFSGIPNTTDTFFVNVEGHVTIGIEEFSFRQYYRQDNVLTTCKGLTPGIPSLCGLVSAICEVPGPGLYCGEALIP